ncbi:MAG TPA: prepilin-type N-terminal cleavage/methylation domain-containing protein [Patescibacteria group bacterium]|nr:prepilin-type N-terminal cleavage/methylation domain-containing protein [Patescibacteria group bacterium]
MKDILKNNKGYTIVELLAVVSILVIISGIISSILYSTLRGSNKVKITTEVTQNGTYAMSVIAKTINDSRNVLQVDGVDIDDCTASPSGKSIEFQRLDGSTTTFSCSNGDLASNSASIINTETVKVDDASCVFTCYQKADDLYALPIIGINFKIEDKNATAEELKGSSDFQSSTALRNYRP